jgi:hypothetical protein
MVLSYNFEDSIERHPFYELSGLSLVLTEMFYLLIHAHLMSYLGGRSVIPAYPVCHSSLSGLRLIENPSDSFGIVKKDPG